MKKKIILLLYTVLMLFLVACGKSEEVKQVESKILQIGEVNLENESIIVEAEESYNNLSDKDKKKVDNYEQLVTAREQYDTLYSAYIQECETLVQEAMQKIEDLDAKGAYEIAIQLPEDYAEEKNDIITKVDNMCYKDTFIVKLENVVSSLPTSTSGPETETANVVWGYSYNSYDTCSSVFGEYYQYLNTYYISSGSDSYSDYSYDMNSQSYQFEDENGNFIQISSSSILGYNSVTLAYDKKADFRAVIESEIEE